MKEYIKPELKEVIFLAESITDENTGTSGGGQFVDPGI